MKDSGFITENNAQINARPIFYFHSNITVYYFTVGYFFMFRHFYKVRTYKDLHSSMYKFDKTWYKQKIPFPLGQEFPLYFVKNAVNVNSLL